MLTNNADMEIQSFIHGEAECRERNEHWHTSTYDAYIEYRWVDAYISI